MAADRVDSSMKMMQGAFFFRLLEHVAHARGAPTLRSRRASRG